MASMQVSVRTAVSYGVGSAKVAGRGALMLMSYWHGLCVVV